MGGKRQELRNQHKTTTHLRSQKRQYFSRALSITQPLVHEQQTFAFLPIQECQPGFYNSEITQPVVCARIVEEMGSHLSK